MIRILMCLVMAAMVLGCQSSNSDSGGNPGEKKPPATSPTTFTGTLQSGIMAIGGEHTGWVLAGDGSSGGIEVDVSKVKSEAEKMAGKRVTISGKMSEKKYVERGKVKVLVAEKIVAAPAPGK